MLLLVVTVTAATTPSITVTSPNGGETWQRGTTHTVSWSYSGSPGSTVKIVLLKGGAEVGTIIASTSIGSGGTGSYTWPIGSSPSLRTGNDFKVSVQSTSQPTIKDVSNNYFTLTSGTSVPGNNCDWKLDLNGNGQWDGSSIDKYFQFALRGDIPVIGDWNGNGKDNIGIFRPSNGIWSLDSNGNTAWDVSDRSMSWGLPGDIPVVGDWNGDGKDNIGIFRPSNGIWSLDSNGNTAWDVSDRSMSWGLPGDVPVVGDWNGDGKDDIGIFRPSNGIWSLDSNGNTAWDVSDRSMSWGLPGDIPVVGDWNGDGKDDIGIFRPGNGIWSLDSNGNTAWDVSDRSVKWGLPGDVPVVGDWNGDGKDDIGTFCQSSSTPSITITSPNGGEIWQRGTTHTVSWSYTDSPGSTVEIVLLKADAEVGTIASGVSTGSGGTGSYTWPISSTGTTGGDFKVKVQSASQPSIKGMSNNYFTLTPVSSITTTPSITVTSPNGGESWQRGTSHTVSWSYTDSPGSTVEIVLLKAGAEVGTIASGVPTGSGGTGSYTWPIGSSPTLTTGGDFTVRVESLNQPSIKGMSNNYFTLTPVSSTTTSPTAAPSITVTSPNGGESWQRGTTHTVSWSYTGSPGSTVEIVLLKSGAEVGTIASGVPTGSGGTGSYTWPIGSSPTLVTGSDFKVSVQSISVPPVTDTSSNYFTITSATTSPTPTQLPSQNAYGAESNPTGNPIGGGAGYTRIISRTDPRVKYVASTRDQLLSSLKSAKSGEVVFVPGNANIDLTGTYGTVIPGGVTLASDRGADGSPGGRIFRYRTDPPSLENAYSKMPTLIVGGDNVRITGLRIEGQDTIQDELFQDIGLEPKGAIRAIERKGLEVDNCEIWGWSLAGVELINSEWSTAHAYVHHNYIHHCQARGYGYGVDIRGGTVLVEANLFDYTRHAIASGGLEGEGYEARYNIHLGHGHAIGGHHFDVHSHSTTTGTIAGNEYKIHHNTFEPTDLYSVGIRSIPEKGVWIDHNIFKGSHPPVFQNKGSEGYGHIYMTDNLIGTNPILSVKGPIQLA